MGGAANVTKPSSTLLHRERRFARHSVLVHLNSALAVRRSYGGTDDWATVVVGAVSARGDYQVATVAGAIGAAGCGVGGKGGGKGGGVGDGHAKAVIVRRSSGDALETYLLLRFLVRRPRRADIPIVKLITW